MGTLVARVSSMNAKARSLVGLGAIAAVTALAPIVGAKASRPGLWYRALRKPPQTPPSWVFGPVWTVLYTLSGLSVWRVWRTPRTPERRRALALWGVQHALNAAWSPLFFKARRPRAAFADLAAMFAATSGYIVAARKIDPRAAKLIAPYLGWLAFAGSINLGVIRRNRHVVAG